MKIINLKIGKKKQQTINLEMKGKNNKDNTSLLKKNIENPFTLC